jgi:hypothetical protein
MVEILIFSGISFVRTSVITYSSLFAANCLIFPWALNEVIKPGKWGVNQPPRMPPWHGPYICVPGGGIHMCHPNKVGHCRN